MSYEIRDILKWYNQFDNIDIVIKTESKEFNVYIRNSSLPHLLGLQYINDSDTRELYRGRKLLNLVNNKSDEYIFNLILKNNKSQFINVKNRIKYFRYFMENLEKATLYEQSMSNSKLKSDFLLVEIERNKYLQLAVATERQDADYFETFLVRNDDKYIDKSCIKEKIISIERYKGDELIPFSFDNVKNRKLIEEYNKKEREEERDDIDIKTEDDYIMGM